MILITHEMEIAEHASRIVSFRDARIVSDGAVAHRRIAAEQLHELSTSARELAVA